jgi:hypothetical protein
MRLVVVTVLVGTTVGHRLQAHDNRYTIRADV